MYHHLKQFGIAVHNFHDTNKRLPNVVADLNIPKDLTKLRNGIECSYLVWLLPFNEQTALYDTAMEFLNAGSGNVSIACVPLRSALVNIHGCPSDNNAGKLITDGAESFAPTNYHCCRGDKGVLVHQSTCDRGAFGSGLNYSGTSALPPFGGGRGGQRYLRCGNAFLAIKARFSYFQPFLQFRQNNR